MLVLDTSALSRVMRADTLAHAHAGGHRPGDLFVVPPSSDLFGEQKARLEARGMLIDDMDIAVAAIAMAHHFGVATCNVRHFGRIEGLRVADWAEALRR